MAHVESGHLWAGDVTGKDQVVYGRYGAKARGKERAEQQTACVTTTPTMPAIVFTDPQVASDRSDRNVKRCCGHACGTRCLSLDNVPRGCSRPAIKMRGSIKGSGWSEG